VSDDAGAVERVVVVGGYASGLRAAKWLAAQRA
jgi:ribulose 1,5-bisphosphate synthetase/thiazole synthase